MRGILREIALKRSLRMQNIGTRQSHERIFQSARDTNETVGIKEYAMSVRATNETIEQKKLLRVHKILTRQSVQRESS